MIPENAKFPPLDTNCSVCGKRQYQTPGGECCVEGHGGAPGVPREVQEVALDNILVPVVVKVPAHPATNPEVIRRQIEDACSQFYGEQCATVELPHDAADALGELELDALVEAIYWRAEAAGVENYAELEPVIDRTLSQLRLELSKDERARMAKELHMRVLFHTDP